MLVVHIGPRKTATTYLQSNFYRNRRQLLRRGWLYPILSLNARNAHHLVASSLDEIRRGKGALMRGIAKAARVAAGRDASILISSEGFRKWRGEDYRLLAERFGQKEVTVVYTLRDPVDLLISNWSESVKVGKTASLPDYAARHLADPLSSGVLNCLVQLRPILAHGDVGVTLLDFEAVKREGGDIFKVFTGAILGVPDLEPVRDKPRNPSLPPEINDYLRLISRTLDIDPKKTEFLFARQFIRTHSPREIAGIAETIRRTGAAAATTLPLSRDAPWYGELEAAIRDRLGDHIVPRPASANIFPRGVVESVSYDIDSLSHLPEVRRHLETSLKKVRNARRRWGRTPVVWLWRYVKRLVSV